MKWQGRPESGNIVDRRNGTSLSDIIDHIQDAFSPRPPNRSDTPQSKEIQKRTGPLRENASAPNQGGYSRQNPDGYIRSKAVK